MWSVTKKVSPEQEESFRHRLIVGVLLKSRDKAKDQNREDSNQKTKFKVKTWHVFLKSKLWIKQVSLKNVLNGVKSVQLV